VSGRYERPALLAAFTKARKLGFTVESVEAALTPPRASTRGTVVSLAGRKKPIATTPRRHD
jgi:hypothetical protein